MAFINLLPIASPLPVTSEQNDNPRDFYPRFFRLGIVNICSNLMVPLAGLVDMAFLGHLEDLKYLAGVAIASVLFDYLYRMAKFLRMGTTGPTAQAEGRDDTTDVILTLLRNGLIALAMGLLMLMLQWPIRNLGFAILSAAPEVKMAGMEYFNARIWGAPAVLINFVFIGWFVGREQSGKVLALSMVGNGANLLLDYWFVYGLGLAGTGVGLATALSQYLMLLLGVLLIGLEGWFRQLIPVWSKIWHPEAMKATLKLNGDIWVRSCVNVSISALFISLSASFGTLILAANTLLLHVVVLTTYLVGGLAFATESLAGSFRGAGHIKKLAPLLQLSLALSLGLGIISALLFVQFPISLFGLLTNHPDVISQVNHYVLWLLPVLILGSMAFMLNGYFLGLTESTIVRDSIVVSAIMGFLPVAGIAWWHHNVQELWLAMALFMVIRVVTQLHKVPSTINSIDG